jgi:hypothetical protein
VMISRLAALIIGWRSDGCGSCPGLVCFRLVAPPLQSAVVGHFLVWDVWFPSHLLLEGTDSIQNFGP